jgi:glycosyltransferase involved in cell wall biosynthesis
MRIIVHDYSGHPFQIQLSRELANRGHDVLHLYSASFQTPQGALARRADDPAGFAIEGVKLPSEFKKDSYVARLFQEMDYGRMVAERIKAYKPDIVLSGNTPLDAQDRIQKSAVAVGARFYFWLQDIYSEAIYRFLSKKMMGVGQIVGLRYKALEYSLLSKSDGVVAITEDFASILQAKGVAMSKINIIENWAPLDELQPVANDNDWVSANMQEGKVKIVYSGTLGLKHNPDLLLELARHLEGAHVYVFSEGKAADYLKNQATSQNIANLSVRPWVPFQDLVKMLSGADLFIAMIEEDAGIFCVPSKVLTYFSVGRPILAAWQSGAPHD